MPEKLVLMFKRGIKMSLIYEAWKKRSQLEIEEKPQQMPQEFNPTTDLGQAEDIAGIAPDIPQDDFNIEEFDAEPEMMPEEPVVEENPAQNREEEVKNTIKNLSEHVNEVAKSVYQMNLTTNQSQELTTKIVTMISDYISSITVERVKNIAEEFLKVEAKRNINASMGLKYNTRHAYRKISLMAKI